MGKLEADALAEQVADQIRSDPRWGAHGGQKDLAAAIRVASATVNQAVNHPVPQMTKGIILRLASALPDEFGWAADRLRSIEYPDATGPARRLTLSGTIADLTELVDSVTSPRELRPLLSKIVLQADGTIHVELA